MTRRPAPDRRPVALTIAGSDSGGGAGIQADLGTMAAGGAYGTSVVTSATAQHTRGVESTHVLPAAEVAAQFDAVVSDFDVRAVKTGMLATAEIVETVTERVAPLEAPLVVDPVMVAASGDRLLEPDAEAAYEDLLAEATLATPNVDEAAVLTGIEPTDEASMRDAGDALLEFGADAALLTGGHAPGDEVTDLLVTPERAVPFSHPRIEGAATHGSGCTLSSAIATRLARGDSLEAAVEAGTGLLQRAIRYYQDVGEGPGAVHHAVALRERGDRTRTAEDVESVLGRLRDADAGDDGPDVAAVVPEVGLQVAGATPYAERPAEVAAVEGRVARTVHGIRPARGVRFGASSHVARFLLAAREVDPSLRFAANCRYEEDVVAALEERGWTVAEFDRTREPAPEAEGSTMQWGARRALERADRTPDAVVDDGAVGKEPMTRLLAADAETLATRVVRYARRSSDPR